VRLSHLNKDYLLTYLLKQQISQRWYYFAAHRHNVTVLPLPWDRCFGNYLVSR